MKLQSALLALTTALLAACGGDGTTSGADLDPAKLLQQGKIEEAVEAIETQLASVEKGSQAELDLMIDYAEGLSHSDPAKAQSSFLDFAKANAELVKPRDFKYVVSHLRTQGAFIEAIEVMHEGKTRWPDDEQMDELVAIIKADVEKAADPAAAAKMKGLGYM